MLDYKQTLRIKDEYNRDAHTSLDEVDMKDMDAKDLNKNILLDWNE